MWFFGKSQKKEELILVFDVASSSVGAGVFLSQPSGIPKILFSTREPMAVLPTISTEQLLASTLKSFEIVNKRVLDRAIGAPRKVFCILSSPWYASQTRTIKFEKNSPFLVSNAMINELIKKEVEIFEKEHVDSYVDLGNKVTPIELKNMKIKLNGYNVLKPINQKAEQLEMRIFMSITSVLFLENLKKIIFTFFNQNKITFSSFVVPTFTVVRDMFTKEEDFILIDIGGEVTEISMVKHGALSESLSFPLGINFMTRGVAEALSCTLDEAKSLLLMVISGHADEATLTKLTPIIGKLKSAWLSKFQESLANLSNDISVPSNIFITVDNDYSIFFSEIIKSEQFSQYTLTESKFKVTFVGTESLHGAATFDKDTNRDAFVVIESIYINRYLL